MSTTPDGVPEWLDGMIADLDRSIEVDTIRLDLARQLRATYGTDEPAEPTPPASPAPASATPKTKRTKKRQAPSNKGKAYERIPCPDCGDRIAKTQLARHRRAKHPAPSGQPGPAAASDPEAEVPASRMYYECSGCGAQAGSREALARHTDVRHHRGLTADEHQAKVGAA